MTNWLRTNKIAAGLMVLIRIYLGWQWLDAGWHKLTGGFNAAGFLQNAVNNPVLESGTKEKLYPNFVAFLDHFALPNAKLFNVVIPLGECLVGAGLILGALTVTAAFFGMLMNFMFLLAGTISSNPWLILFGTIVLLAGPNAGRFGADYVLLPWLKAEWRRLTHRTPKQPPLNPKGAVG